jgi:hypothetical protein
MRDWRQVAHDGAGIRARFALESSTGDWTVMAGSVATQRVELFYALSGETFVGDICARPAESRLVFGDKPGDWRVPFETGNQRRKVLLSPEGRIQLSTTVEIAAGINEPNEVVTLWFDVRPKARRRGKKSNSETDDVLVRLLATKEARSDTG